MPSNCLWRPLPVCLPERTPTQPRRSQQPALPLCSLSAPRLHYCWGFIPHVVLQQQPPSCGLRVSKSGGIERATGVRRSRRRAAVALTPAAWLRALYLYCFLQCFDWFSRCDRLLDLLWNLPGRVFSTLDVSAFTGTPKENLTDSPGLSDLLHLLCSDTLMDSLKPVFVFLFSVFNLVLSQI